MNERLASARRIVVKVGSSLVTNEGRGADAGAIGNWCRQMAVLGAGGRCFAEAKRLGTFSTNAAGATGEVTEIALAAGCEARAAGTRSSHGPSETSWLCVASPPAMRTVNTLFISVGMSARSPPQWYGARARM